MDYIQAKTQLLINLIITLVAKVGFGLLEINRET
jgi:hypothetical protein